MLIVLISVVCMCVLFRFIFRIGNVCVMMNVMSVVIVSVVMCLICVVLL